MRRQGSRDAEGRDWSEMLIPGGVVSLMLVISSYHHVALLEFARSMF